MLKMMRMGIRDRDRDRGISGLYLVFTAFIIIGIAGATAMKITDDNEKPVLGNGQYHRDFYKSYDENTMNTMQIEHCMKIKFHMEESELLVNDIVMTLDDKQHLRRNSTNLHYKATQNLNELTQLWNDECAGKRYYLDDYNMARWD
ncbi:hypothetical protein [Vibrio scophthalmi]|uniref:hypothetical protein n=1 Tax=Vibrio scophthalmi TaxID=45658 RepID=UPI0018D28199|nr:hypothetical protein [Vibrio scophthalmi]